jgi:hypothetical protein
MKVYIAASMETEAFRRSPRQFLNCLAVGFFGVLSYSLDLWRQPFLDR